MKHLILTLAGVSLVILSLTFSSCETSSSGANRGKVWEHQLGAISPEPKNPDEAHKELNIKVDLIPDGKYGRRLFRPMKPQYVTIHSTQNYTGDAYDHAKALKRGALRGGVCGYLCWHFTVQDNVVVQHIPTSERGEHADFDGPGNRYSIGIEMCEHQGNNQLETMERTAKLAASLMYHHQIPIENLRAHYHWPRQGYETPNKNCPHYLMENGKPGDTWRWFVGRVERHYQKLVLYAEKARLEQEAREKEQRMREIVYHLIERVTRWIG